MAEANVNDRASIERLYPRADFERDAGENSDAKASVHRGLRIVSGVDASGTFRAERGQRHVGENDPEGDVRFVAPFLRQAHAPVPQSPLYGGGAAPADAPDKGGDYRAFIDHIIATARSAEFKDPIGRGEERLHGFHGG